MAELWAGLDQAEAASDSLLATVASCPQEYTYLFQDAAAHLTELEGEKTTASSRDLRAKLEEFGKESSFPEPTESALRARPVDKLTRTETRPDTPATSGNTVALEWCTIAPGATVVLVEGQPHPSRVVERQTGMSMVLILPGVFLMGSPLVEPEHQMNERLHRRVIRRPFWLAETELTQAQWSTLVAENPSEKLGGDLPVEHVTFEAAQSFVRRLGDGFRLPSEAEWEYAARAGDRSARTHEPSEMNVGSQGIEPVARFRPNGFGLYDTLGNVEEWCEDTFGTYPRSGNEEPRRGGRVHVTRGCGWWFEPEQVRVALRRVKASGDPVQGAGLRVARSL
jgi:formylglycine-generating enzyme required for sulfatase activity